YRLNARPLRAAEFGCLVLELLQERRCQLQHGPFEVDQSGSEHTGLFPQSLEQRLAVGFQRLSAIVFRSRQDLPAHQCQEQFRRSFGYARLDASCPSGAWKLAREQGCRLQKLVRFILLADQVGEPVGKAAAAPALHFGSTDPPPEFGCLMRREMARKGAVGRVEQMMALIENEPAKISGYFLLSAVGRAERMVDRDLMQHQSMIGDDDLRLAACPDSLLDEASSIMRTGRINAFAPPVGKP